MEHHRASSLSARAATAPSGLVKSNMVASMNPDEHIK
jgi:hypothetical protein